MSRGPQGVAALHATVGGVGVLPDSVHLFRGPYIHGNTGTIVNIAYNGDPGSDTPAVTTSSEWAGLGAKKRNETVEVLSSIIVAVGDTEDAPQLAMEEAYAVLDACETAVHASPAMGLPPPAWAIVAETTYTEYPTGEDGLQGVLVWTLRAFERP